MKQEPSIPVNFFVTHAKEVEEIFRKAVREELLKHKRLGHSIATSRNGEVVILSAEEIPVEEEPDLTSRLHPTQPGIE